MSQSVSCLSSMVRNTSGQSMYFWFLGSHGVTLANNGEFSALGDIWAHLSSHATGVGERAKKAFSDCIAAGLLVLKANNMVVLHDTHHDNTYLLNAHNDLLGLSDPCFESTGA